MVWYSSIYIAPHRPWASRGAFVSISSKKRDKFYLRSDKEAERLDDEKEARADGGRRFQRGGPATEKDLDLAIIALVRETKSSRLSRESRVRRDEAEVGSRMASRRYLGATPIWALKTICKILYSIRVEIGSQWRSSLM